ncbi:hypothetical protein Pgy4_40752, partial [Pseudomonas savastanoi pv. glycinea str. race 4]
PEGIVPIASAVLWNHAEAAEVRKNANVAPPPFFFFFF